MSVSSSKRDRQTALTDGNGKDTADRSNGHAEMTPAGTNGRVDRHVRISDKTDEQLLSAYREGDRSSFASLVDRYQRELFHFLVRFLGDRAAAEDLFPETFLRVHQPAEQFALARRFRPWLFTIAANKARDLM